MDFSQFTPIVDRCQSPVFDLIRQARARLDREERAAAEAARALARHTMLAGRHRAVLRELRKLGGEGRRG